MKEILFMGFVGACWLLSCAKQQPTDRDAVSPKDSTTKKDTIRFYKYKIGQGVEIYNAKLDWVYEPKRVYSVATITDTVPAVRYDDLLAYRYDPGSRSPLLILTQPAEKLLTMKPAPPVTTTIGYVVTVDKVPIFNTLLINGSGGVDDKGVHLWLPVDWERSNPKGLPQNSAVVQWDSLLYSTNPPAPRNLPDPRYDARLIEQVRKDGKLIGF